MTLLSILNLLHYLSLTSAVAILVLLAVHSFKYARNAR